MQKTAFCKMVKRFDIGYHIAKHEKPFAYYPSLVNLEKRHGVGLEDANINPKQARVFTQYLAEQIQLEVSKQVLASRYIRVLVDGSTDRSTAEKEVLYVKSLHKGVPRMPFLGIEDTESTTVDGILHCIRSLLISKGIPNWTDRLVGFGADGASVTFGCRQGIYTKLKNDMPWLMGIHCLAHRLELACKNAFQGTYFNQEIDGFLSFYTSF
ncbi:hypothetical protein VZT92_026399 [Zoarces viviparus]|uniref:DUF4371 domain-containing protein n=1 Tax=Zoarces viviparus TaxID=48416 RepID=A0AAW1E0T5_ZOAVI